MDIYDFTPIQYPADDRSASWMTTHFDFHSIHDNVLKLDILGHDDPYNDTDVTGFIGYRSKTIPVDDKETMQIFSSPASLGCNRRGYLCKTGIWCT